MISSGRWWALGRAGLEEGLTRDLQAVRRLLEAHGHVVIPPGGSPTVSKVGRVVEGLINFLPTQAYKLEGQLTEEEQAALNAEQKQPTRGARSMDQWQKEEAIPLGADSTPPAPPEAPLTLEQQIIGLHQGGQRPGDIAKGLAAQVCASRVWNGCRSSNTRWTCATAPWSAR